MAFLLEEKTFKQASQQLEAQVVKQLQDGWPEEEADPRGWYRGGVPIEKQGRLLKRTKES